MRGEGFNIMSNKKKGLFRKFLSFAIPSMIAQWVFALYSMVDGMFVARGVSEVALSAVNISTPFNTMLFSISLMFAVGCSTIVSICFGRSDREKANRVYTQNILVVFLLSVVITVAVLLNLERVALFLGATPATLGYVKQYVGTIAVFSSCFMVSYSFEILIKADGYPTLATLFVTMGAVTNLVLDALFVLVFHWGVWGAAFATGISQLVVVLLYLTHFLSRRAQLRFTRFRFDPATLWRTVRLGTSSGITELSAGIITFLMNHAIVRYLQDDALISFSVISYANTIVVMSMTGIAQGMQPLVSFYHGQQDTQKCRQLLRYGFGMSAVFSLAIFAIVWLGAAPIVGCFISRELEALFAYSVKAFHVYSISFLILGYNILLSGYFTSIEREMSSVAISLGRGFVFLYLSIQVLPRLLGGEGVWWCATCSEILCLIMACVLWRTGTRTSNRALVD